MQQDKEKFTVDSIRNYDKLNGRLIYLKKRSSRINPHILEAQNPTLKKIKWTQRWDFNLQKGNRGRNLHYKMRRTIMLSSFQWPIYPPAPRLRRAGNLHWIFNESITQWRKHIWKLKVIISNEIRNWKFRWRTLARRYWRKYRKAIRRHHWRCPYLQPLSLPRRWSVSTTSAGNTRNLKLFCIHYLSHSCIHAYSISAYIIKDGRLL